MSCQRIQDFPRIFALRNGDCGAIFEFGRAVACRLNIVKTVGTKRVPGSCGMTRLCTLSGLVFRQPAKRRCLAALLRWKWSSSKGLLRFSGVARTRTEDTHGIVPVVDPGANHSLLDTRRFAVHLTENYWKQGFSGQTQ